MSLWIFRIALKALCRLECGGIDVFIGTVRNKTKGKTVLRLEFEAYEKWR